jgi:sulfite reductase beta subunit-like hemoprotein
MWLVEAMGVDAFRQAIEQRMGQALRREVGCARAASGAATRGCRADCKRMAYTWLRCSRLQGHAWARFGAVLHSRPRQTCFSECSLPKSHPFKIFASLSFLPPRQVHVAYDDEWPRRDVLGVHPQKQAGLFWAGACVPAGRLLAADFHALADACEK